MANITVDIQAKVVGYEQSIKALQAALAKVDPGSDMGKSITKAMEQAQSQVKTLSKNMFPKASSDSQIDAIIEKTNRAGEAIQRVASLLQGVQISDLNLGAFGGDIETFKNQIASLQTELDSKLNAGIIKAVGESEQLRNVFQSLGTDLSKATGATLLDDLSKGAQKAANDVTELEKKLEKTQTSISNYQAIDSALKSSKLGTLEGRVALDDELKAITGNYEAVIEQLRTTITNGLTNLKTDTKLDTESLIKTFFSDLTPENVQAHIQNLFNTLSSQGVFSENERRKFYEAIFGNNDQYSTTNINTLTKSIGLDKAYEQYKTQFKEFYQKIVNDIDGKDQAKISRLISDNELDKAVNATTAALDSAYSKIYNNIKSNQKKLNEALSDKDNIALQLGAARQVQSNLGSAEQELRTAIEKVSEENKTLRTEITQLREQLNQRLGTEVNNIRSTGATQNSNINQGLRESLEISEAYKNQLAQVAAKEQALGKLQGVVQRWFSIYAAIRMVRQAIDSVISTVKELDATITEIAIVTSMDQSELWDQMPKYTQLARDYAASISGVYQVSQLYYQQGLQTADVMALTEQTLKMARISGLDYAQATDYMTNAVRSFKMEMTDAQRVVDVYSAIAASSATSVTELASAMSKTASSAQAVGSSFENTTAMMAVMIEATRESAENIGSAMKSIISRYGEMTSDPSKLVDSEGQEMSLNRVDKALQTVGISIHNAAGEFRNFDEVIMELAQKWDTIDTNTQRYIATIMAGNRQQSRFLALVSSYDRLKELSAEAADSEDASQLQFLKTLDSVEAKTQQLQTSIQALYVNSGLEDFYKSILDAGNRIMTTFDQLSEKNGLISVVGKVSGAFTTLATLVTTVFTTIKAHYSMNRQAMLAEEEYAIAQGIADEQAKATELGMIYDATTGAYIKAEEDRVAAAQKAADERLEIARQENNKQQTLKKTTTPQQKMARGGMLASTIGLAATTYAASLDINQNRGLKAGMTGAGGALSGLGTTLMMWSTMGPGIAIAAGALSALPSIIEAIGMSTETTSEKLERLSKNIENANNTKLEAKSNLQTLESYKEKYDELNEKQYQSEEAKQEFIKIQNEIAASYPELIKGMTQEGNYVVDMTTAYEQLAAAKRKAYSEAFSADLGAEIQGLSDIHYVMKNIYGVNPFKDGGILSTNTYGKYDQFIYDQIQGSTDKTISSHWGDSLNTNDYFQTFFNGRENFQKLMEDRGTSRGYTGYSSKAFEPTNTNAKQTVNQIWDLFLESAQKGLSFAEAQNNLNASLTNGQIAFNENPNVYNIGTSKNDYVNLASSAIEGFDQEIYSHMITIAKATEFQKDLIHNKIKSSNEEYVNILKKSAASAMDTESNELQNYAASLDLTEGLENYIKENENRIGALEWDATEGKSIRINEDKLISEYYTDKDEQWYNAFIEAHQKDLDDTANNIYKNLGSYSASEIERQDINDNARTLLLKALNEEYGKISERYSNWIQNLDINDSDIKTALDSYQNDFGPAFLQSIQNQYEKILNNTALDNNTKSIQLSNLTSIYDIIQDIQNQDFSAGATLLQTMQSADLTSLTGINNLIDLIQSLDIDFDTSGLIELIQSFSSNLVVNFETEFQTYTEEIINKSKEFEKTFSKLTKGISFDEMLAAVNELGVGIEDFDNINGQYYLKDLSILKDKYKLSDQAFEQNINNRIAAYGELSDAVYEEISEGISVNFDKHLNSLLPQDLREKLLDATNFEEYNKVLEEIQEYADSSEESAVNYADIIDLIQVDELKSESQANLNDLIDNAKNFAELETYLNEHVQDSWFTEQGLSRTQVYNEIRGFMNSESYGKMTFLDYVKNVLPEQWNAIQQATNDYYEDMFAQNLLAAGDVEGFIETAAKKSITNTVKSEDAFKNATVEEINDEVIKRYEKLLQNNPQLQSQIISGDINNLPVELQKYVALIYDTFHSARESVVNSLIASVGGNGTNLIKVTDTNKKILEDLQAEGKGWVTGNIVSGNYVTIAAKKLTASASEFQNYIAQSFETTSEKIKALSQYHQNQYSNTQATSLDKVLTTEAFSYEDMLQYLVNNYQFNLDTSMKDLPMLMDKLGLAFNSAGEVIVSDYEAWITSLKFGVNKLKANGKASQADLNKAQKKLDDAKNAQEQAIASSFDGILKDYSNISTEAIEALANSLGMSFDEVLTYLTPNGNGSYRLDMTKTQDLIAKAKGKVSEATLQAINQSIGSIADEYSKSLEDVRTYMKNGTTSRADMEKFVQQYNQLTGESINADQAFTYNSTKKKWTLSGDYVIKYAQKRAEQLQLVDDEYNQYINDLLSADVGESIISTIDAIGTQQFEDSQKDLLASLTTYYTNKYQSEMPTAAIPNDKALQAASAQVIDAGAQVLDTVIGGAGQLLDNMFGQKSGGIADQIGRKQAIAGAGPMSRFGGFYTGPSVFGKFMTSLGTLASTAMSSATAAIDPALEAVKTLTTILKGGSPAVEAYKTINPHATQEELKKIFNSRMNILNSAISDVDQLVAGQFVGTEGKLYEILKQAGAIDADADGVVAAGFSMVSVYTQIYTEMYNTLGHTNADLNNIYAKLLTEEDKQQITLKDALSNASGMSYEAFAQLMNTYNLDMRKVMDNQALAGNLARDGFGNIVITNFKAFSEYMKSNGADWDFTSSEIKAAYSSYVDAKAELLNQDAKDMQSLADQISGLTEAKPKTAINVSYIEDALGTDALKEIATRFNAALQDGILTITDYTDIPGLINEIARQAEKENKLLPEQLAELADAVHGLLSDITSLITNGINGSLNNIDVQKLLSWYRKYTGNQEAQLQFTNTAEGLKLSNRSARELYTTMRQVDALQADIVFDELKESLIESEDHFKTIQSTAAYIDALRKGTAYPDNSERIADLNEELALAEKINAERSTTEDDSFKFMEGKIPAGQNNPLNYWQNWAEAFKTIKASMKGNKKSKNTMAYEDFYNIVTEMGNLTKLTGQAVQYGDVLVDDSANAAEKSVTAAELIESAAGALKNVDGKLVVDLSKIGVDLNMSSLKGLGKELDSQVDAVADSQIEMLESIAKLLEVIVAMENLKDIDVDFDGEIDLSELFEDWDIETGDPSQFTTKAQDAAKKILDQADALGKDSDLYKALEAVRINGKTVRELLNDVATNVKDVNISAEQYQAAINALYQAMLSNDYDLDNIGESLFNILSKAGLDSVAIDVGEKTYYLTGNTRYVVDWNDEDAINKATEALSAAGFWTNGKDAKSNIQDAIDKLNNEDIELTKEEKVNLEYAISIATGSISIKQNKDKKTQKKGKFVGNYKGQTFYSDDKEQLENVVKEALGLEEEGFTVKINEDANIDATYKQGRTDIKYDTETGQYFVDGKPEPYGTLKQAVEAQISQGFANQSDVGTYNIKGEKFEVAYSAELQAAYSIWHSALGDIYYYNGEHFSNYNDLIAYVSATNLTQNKNQWNQSGSRKAGKETFTYKKNGEIKIIIDYSSGEPKVTYEAFGKSVTDPQDIAKLTEIQNLVTASENQGGKISLNKTTGNIEAQFVYDGMLITATINAEAGEFTYTFTDTATGTTIEASSLSALKSAIAAILGKKSSQSGDDSGTITVNNVTFNYKMNAEGHIEVKLANEDQLTEETQKQAAQLAEQLNLDKGSTSKTKEPVNITATSVNVTLADGASVTLDGKLTDDQKTIKDLPPMKGEVSELTLTIADDAAVTLDPGSTISQTISEVFKSLKTEIDELDSKPLTEIATAISTIVTAIDDLSKNKGIDTLNEELGKLSVDTLAEIGKAFETISTNLQDLATSGNWVILTLALTMVNALLTSINEHSEVFTTLATSITNFPIDALNSIKNTLQEMAEALAKIDAKKKLQLDIKADGLDSILNKLQQIAALLGELTGGNVTVNNNNNGGDNGANPSGFVDPRKFNLPDPSKYGLPSPTPQTEAPSFVNGNGPIDPNFVQKIKTEYEQPSNPIEPPAREVQVPTQFEPPKEGMEPPKNPVKVPVESDGDIEGEGKITWTGEPENTDFTGTGNIAWTGEPDTGPFQADGYITWHNRGGGGGSNEGIQDRKTDKIISPTATGNFGLAKSKGTLMGELGPELVVSNGRYFVAGQNGAEMVNLADDAIVFNHLQTEQLLKNGMSSGRGRAVTNERNAVAFATGNMNGGPAMASASAALAAIRQLINMWKSLKNANVSDLAGAGGGGGGGGGGTQNKIVDPKAWVDTVERWYNLTQEIARLEEEITHQETIRTKLQSDWQKNGNAYYRSQKKSLDALNQQIAAQEQLNISRREYFNKRVEALKDEALGQIYTFDEEGQLQFRKDVTINGKQGGMEFLTDLYGFNNLGKANYTNKEKYDILMASGFADYMKYDSNGMEIKVGGEGTEEDYETFYEQATQAFRDRMDQYNEATQSLLDEINKGEDDIEKLETDRNELMKEIRDNQMELENEILDAIVESRQRQIDALQDQRDALEETTGKYIEGLSDALEKERDMYERQESQDELNRNKRRLAILQRSGGSAADISSLQSDISSQERDLYFDAQQAQIDAIQEASDLEIERLDKQIELMTETLEFQQEYGLLWGEVYEVMDRSSQEIVDFIKGNSAEFWKMSTLAQVQAMNDETFKAEYWTSYKDDLDVMATEIREAQLARDYAIFDQRMKAEYGDNYDANGRYRQAFENEYRQGWNIDEATEVARKLYHDEVIKPQEEARRAAERAAAEAAVQAVAEQAASGGGSNGCGGSCSAACKDDCGGRCGTSCQQNCKGNCGGKESYKTINSTDKCNSQCVSTCTGSGGKKVKAAHGGYATHGIYELGERGTEAVLTASQTRVLRNNILSNRPNSLISLLKTYNEGFNQNKLAQATAALQKEDENPSIFIENASVNMNVQQISNDYDARRAGEQALNEIMRIARKSGATNSVRR